VAEESVDLVRRELNNHQVALMLQLAPKLPPVHGDRVQLQQVIINLLMNAIQAMAACAPGQAVLVLQTRRLAGRHACWSSASAIPVPASPLKPMPRLFEPSTAPRTTAWAWDCRSAVRSSKPTAGASGSASRAGQPGGRRHHPLLLARP
jgi:hypothetical protein